MTKGLEALSEMEYPGRVILIGKSTAGKDFVAYAITGRSPSSRARKFEQGESSIRTAPTNTEVLRKGIPELLIYNAIKRCGRYVAVSNGAQTDLISLETDSTSLEIRFRTPAEILTSAFSRPFGVKGIDLTQYEPDIPNFTPRISGILAPTGTAALAIAKREQDGTARNYFEFTPVAGTGKFIPTYTGVNKDPLPSFVGEPIEVLVRGANAQEVAEEFYEALAPRNPDKDFRVGVVVSTISSLPLAIFESAILNRCDLEKKNGN